jgi:hypothetical protein
MPWDSDPDFGGRDALLVKGDLSAKEKEKAARKASILRLGSSTTA